MSEELESGKVKLDIDDVENNLKIYDEWFKKAEKVELDTLMTFIRGIMDGYEHNYESYVYACTACAIATTFACGTELSGAQAGFIAKLYPLYFYYVDNKSGVGFKNYDLMLYPQYQYHFEKRLTPKTWKMLQEMAKTEYEKHKEDDNIPWHVKAHWKSIIDGQVPFGYEVWDS